VSAPLRAAAGVRPTGHLRVAMARWTARHPERGVVAAAVVAWVILLGTRLGGARSGGWTGVVPGSPHGGHDVLAVAGGPAAAPVGVAAAAWLLMVVAMMGPVMVPRVRRVARGCLGRERLPATAATLAGALGVWSGVGVVAVALGTVAGAGRQPAVDPLVVATVWLVVAGWQLTPPKSAALARCHALRLPPGRATVRSWATGGAAYAAWCVVSCGPAMIAMVLTGHPLVLMAMLTVGLTAERVAHRPQRAVHRLAGGITAAAVVVVLVGSPQVLG
jgi:predicted metal-binding membrane protein